MPGNATATANNILASEVGAIFAIIPLLNIVGLILVLVGAYQVKGRLPAAR